MHPHDPRWSGQQPPQGQPPPWYGPPAHHPAHHQRPVYPPRVVKTVETRRGLGGLSHTVHLVLTIVTCGFWGLCVWLPWWIFRTLFPKRRVTRHYHH